MSGELVAMVGMVCVTLGVPAMVALYFGRSFYGRADGDGGELGTGPGGGRPRKS